MLIEKNLKEALADYIRYLKRYHQECSILTGPVLTDLT